MVMGCGGLGLWIAARVRRRPQELREAMMALTLLDTEIFWSSTPLPEAFAALEERMEKPWRLFFGELKQRLRRGEAAGEAWRDTIAAQRAVFCLKTEDWSLLKDVGKGLGRSDRQEQHKQLELIQRQLAPLREQSAVWAEKQAKMWSYLGFMLGVVGVLILI